MEPKSSAGVPDAGRQVAKAQDEGVQGEHVQDEGAQDARGQVAVA